MELHEEIQQNNVFAIIPARLASTRLASKMLCEIDGKPLILHTLAQASKAALIDHVIVATDSSEIYDVVTAAGAEAVMTSIDHQSGSDRIAEVGAKMPVGSIIVNVQGDEPLISPATIDATVAALIADENADISTASEPMLSVDELLNANVVKVATGGDGYALYFSRSPIPFPREAVLEFGDIRSAIEAKPELLATFRKHTGIYAYRREYLIAMTKLAPSNLEKIEMLEQLRAMENGAKIRVVHLDESSVAVDTQEDLDRVKNILEGN